MITFFNSAVRLQGRTAQPPTGDAPARPSAPRSNASGHVPPSVPASPHPSHSCPSLFAALPSRTKPRSHGFQEHNGREFGPSSNCCLFPLAAPFSAELPAEQPYQMVRAKGAGPRTPALLSSCSTRALPHNHSWASHRLSRHRRPQQSGTSAALRSEDSRSLVPQLNKLELTAGCTPRTVPAAPRVTLR